MSWWQRSPWRSFGALALAWFVLHARLLLGKRVLPWDAADEFYPTLFFNAHSLRHGLAPWWNPYIYGGYPQIADPQGMLFSPLITGWMMIPAMPGQTWFAWGVLLHLLMGACAMLALLRHLKTSELGALLGALVYLAGGVASARLEHVSIVIAYAWAPVVWLALQRFIAAPGLGRGALLGLGAGLMLTSLVQFSYLMSLMLIGFGIVATWSQWSAYVVRQRWMWLAGVLIAGVLALALALPQLLLSAAFASLSNRAELPLDAATPGSLTWRSFITLLLPNGLHALRGPYDGPASIVEAFFYIGALPSMMLLGLGRAWRMSGQRTLLIFLASAVLLAILYGLGTHTPFYGWLYQWLPGVKQFRRPSDAAYLINLALAMAVAVGATHLNLADTRERSRILAIAALWLVVASLTMRADGVRWQVASIAAALVCAVAYWRLRVSPAHLVFWLMAIVVVDYRSFNLNGTFNEGKDYSRFVMHDGAADYLLAHANDAAFGLPARMEPVKVLAGWDNLVMVAGIRSTQGYNPLRYALYDTWYGARVSMQEPWPVRPYNAGPGGTVSGLLNAQFAIRAQPAPGVADAGMPEGFEKVLEGHTEVWRNTRAYPGILTPTTMLTSDAGPTPEQWATTPFRDAFWLTPRDAADRAEALSTAPSCAARLAVSNIQHSHTSLSLRTSSPQGAGWVVVSELDFPGWQARIDGAPVATHRANGMFRAVCVPAGEHELSFRFQPWTMVAEAWRRHRASKL